MFWELHSKGNRTTRPRRNICFSIVNPILTSISKQSKGKVNKRKKAVLERVEIKLGNEEAVRAKNSSILYF